MNKSVRRLSLLLVTAVILTALSGCVYFPPPVPTSQPAPAPAPPPVPVTPINPDWTPPQPETATITLPSIADVVARIKPSVVAITTEVVTLDFFNRPFTQQGAGSGWIIDSDGIIVTNNHVVEGARTITVALDDGRTFNADPKNVFTDALNDIAILQIDAQNLPAVSVSTSKSHRVGDWVVVIGNSLGLGISAKEGIISRVSVDIPVTQAQTLYDLIETSAAVNPGNSGGPLVDLAGEVIGMTSAKIATSGVEGMGYAISTETALPIIEALVKNGYVVRPWLGISLYTVDQFTAARYNLAMNQGALVTQVAQGSPADRAGIKPGDVIVSFNGKEMTTAESLIRAIHTTTIGQPVPLTFYRGTESMSAEIISAESPPP
ncbi:MAG: trypsin-like peptidase domain-containing protein [Chloroflexota bacterium]